ncbi:MAG: hypothetical protein ACI8RZ_004372 [Myxococcota bacterium]|jgi:hypothetical protein
MGGMLSGLSGATLVENLINLRIDSVVSDYFSESVLPLAHTFAADIEVVCDHLAALAVGKSVKETTEVQASIALDKIPSDPLAALG